MDRSASISVIIPVYQHTRSLTACVQSLEAQSYPATEIIVVDDGSEPPISDLPGNVYLLHQEHAGAPAARNAGARAASGERMLFADADAVFVPHALERLTHALSEHPEASYAYSAFRFGWKRFTSYPFDADRLRRMPYIHTSALIRRAHFPEFDASLARFQDWDLWLTMLSQGHVGTYVPETLFRITNTRGTMSRWLPRFLYHIPWKTPRVRAYEAARQRILEKHHLRATGAVDNMI